MQRALDSRYACTCKILNAQTLCPPITKPGFRAICSSVVRCFFNRAMATARPRQSGRRNHQSRWSLDSTMWCKNNRAHSLLWWRFIPHTCVLQHVGPLATLALMTVFQVLAKVVCSVELLRLIALSKLVDAVQMIGSDVPLRRVGKLFTAVATNIGNRRRGRMERSFYA